MLKKIIIAIIIIFIIAVIGLVGILFFTKYFSISKSKEINLNQNLNETITKVDTNVVSKNQLNIPNDKLPVLSLVSKTITVKVNDPFEVVINFDANGNQIRGGDISLSYDPKYLEVIDSNPQTSTLEIAPGSIFPNPWIAANQANNNTGKIILSINTFETFTGSGVFGTVSFKAKAPISATQINFDPAPNTKITIANSKGQETGINGREPINITIVP